MSLKASPRVGPSENDYYALADFLGVPITLSKEHGLSGKGPIRTDWGFATVAMVGKIFDSYVDPATGSCCVLLGLQEDLGIGVTYTLPTRDVNAFIIDRSKLDARGVAFFGGEKPVKTVLDGFERMRNVAVARFDGRIDVGVFDRVL